MAKMQSDEKTLENTLSFFFFFLLKSLTLFFPQIQDPLIQSVHHLSDDDLWSVDLCQAFWKAAR